MLDALLVGLATAEAVGLLARVGGTLSPAGVGRIDLGADRARSLVVAPVPGCPVCCPLADPPEQPPAAYVFERLRRLPAAPPAQRQGPPAPLQRGQPRAPARGQALRQCARGRPRPDRGAPGCPPGASAAGSSSRRPGRRRSTWRGSRRCSCGASACATASPAPTPSRARSGAGLRQAATSARRRPTSSPPTWRGSRRGTWFYEPLGPRPTAGARPLRAQPGIAGDGRAGRRAGRRSC